MDIHNLMEDIVVKFLDEVLKEKNDVCKCNQCKLNMICYALNKICPMYVDSSRGIIHLENEKRGNSQKDIDVMSAVMEAINTVSKTKRHGNNIIAETTEEKKLDGCYFNFPHIVGRIIESKTFMPSTDVEVRLYYDTQKELVEMANEGWKNPLKIVDAMDGTFTFWPASIKAKKIGIQKKFQLNVELIKTGYNIIKKFFGIRLVSTIKKGQLKMTKDVFHLNDIYLYEEEL